MKIQTKKLHTISNFNFLTKKKKIYRHHFKHYFSFKNKKLSTTFNNFAYLAIVSKEKIWGSNLVYF